MHGVVIAANGLVGKCIVSELKGKGLSHEGFVHSQNSNHCRKLDIEDFEQVQRVLMKARPEVVYLCANKPGGVNACENDFEGSKRFHLSATQNLGEICREIGSKLVFISTDYVFPDREKPFDEDDQTAPLNVYGELKLEAENWIRSNLTNFLIIRTTNIYGWDPETKTPNFFMATYRKLFNGEKVGVPSCLFGNPTYAPDLASAIVDLSEKGVNGLYHIVGPEYMNRFEWAQKVCKILGLDENMLEEISTIASLPKRPQRVCLSTTKLRKQINYEFKGVDGALREIKNMIDKEKVN